MVLSLFRYSFLYAFERTQRFSACILFCFIFYVMASVLDSEFFVSKDYILFIFVSLVLSYGLVNNRAQKTFC